MAAKLSSVWPKYTTVTVASGSTSSAEVDVADQVIVGIFVPSTFDGTTITFTASATTAGTFMTVQADNTASTAYTITTTASRYVPLPNLAIPAGLRFIKLVCGTSQSSTDTLFVIATRPL